MRLRAALALTFLLALAAAGCGDSGPDPSKPTKQPPKLGVQGKQPKATVSLGFPAFATKNTTRVGGADPVADAAAVAQAVYSARTPVTRPAALTLVDKDSWQAGIAASLLMSAPVRAPVLLTDGKDLPGATEEALSALAPVGSRPAGGAQIIRVGDVATPKGYKTTDIQGDNPFALAQAVDKFQSAAVGEPSDRIVVASGDDPAYAMPAAGWAARGGDPVLFVHRDSVPVETRQAIATHQQPKIYVLGPPAAISDKVFAQLRLMGDARRISGKDPVANAIAFSRYADGQFGWGVVDPGHGLVFANVDRPADAAAAAPLSASGTYGPLLLLEDPDALTRSLQQYLLDIQPGYREDPTRGVYNHGWLMGDESAVTVELQSRIDSLLEIVPVR